MNTLDRFLKMPTSGVSTRNSTAPRAQNPKQNVSTSESPAKSPAAPASCTLDSIRTQLKEINDQLKKTIKVDDIKDVIKSVVAELFQNHQEKIEKRINDEVAKLREENEKLRSDNKKLTGQVGDLDEVINSLHKKLEDNEAMTRMALSKANYNEQYSRKNNIKFHGFRENKGENLLQTLNDTLSEVGVEIADQDVVAIHRIPGKKDWPRPILIKLRNPEAKARVMRKRSGIKSLQSGKVKVTDDVTKDNSDLISKLLANEKISAAWYFNGAVYGQCNSRRIKFDLFDDIDKKLRKR
jgi:chaperonin cofactor prefoldin